MSVERQLWVLAGGNGVGKSTFYKSSLLPKRGVRFLNADLIARSINPENTEQVSYQAANLVGRLRDELLHKGITFCFETVFSHPSKIDFIAKAKAFGYQIVLVYIHLNALDLNEARVSQRVSEGGHNVPPEKIRNRLPRTMMHVATALQLVDEAWLLDNSSHDEPFKQVALIRKGKRIKTIDSLPVWAKQILKHIPENRF